MSRRYDPRFVTVVLLSIVGSLSIPGCGTENLTETAACDATFLYAHADDDGYPVSGAADVDSDGFDDILVGACLDEDGGTAAGAAYLVLGAGL